MLRESGKRDTEADLLDPHGTRPIRLYHEVWRSHLNQVKDESNQLNLPCLSCFQFFLTLLNCEYFNEKTLTLKTQTKQDSFLS